MKKITRLFKRFALLVILLNALAFQVIGQTYTFLDDDVVVENGVIVSCTYDFALTDIIIPDTIDGQAIKSISDASPGVFSQRGITSVQLPNTIVKIGQNAFFDNVLSGISLPDTDISGTTLTNWRDGNDITYSAGDDFTDYSTSYLALFADPVIMLSDSLVNFGNVPVGGTDSLEITIINHGDVVFNITDITLPTDYTSSWSTALISAWGNESLWLYFSPSQTGVIEGDLNIVTDMQTAGNKTISLLGVGAQPSLMHVIPDSLVATVNVCGGIVTKQFSIENNGDGVLEYEMFVKESLSLSLDRLNGNYQSLIDIIPNRFAFTHGETGNSIGDGGQDMYDGGNKISTNRQSNVSYSNDAVILSNAFGEGGKYFTKKFPGLFVLGADITNVSDFSISGDNGADGRGSVDASVIRISINNIDYIAFIKRVYNTSDPSINHMIIIRDNGLAYHTYNTDSNNDQHTVHNLNGVDELYYLLYAGASGFYIDDANARNIMEKFLHVVIPNIQISPNAALINSGNTQSIELVFNSEGMVAGSYESKLFVSSNSPYTPKDTVVCTFNVNGSPELALSTEALAFDETQVNASVNNSLWVYNAGCDTLRVTNSLISSPVFSLSQPIFNVAPFDSTLLEFTFAPASSVDYNGTLVFESDAGNYEVMLNGTGAGAPVISLSGNIDAKVNECSGTTTKQLTISNVGNASLNYKILSNSWVSTYVNFSDIIGTVPMGESRIIDVELSSLDLNAGIYLNTISIESNDPLNEVANFDLNLTVEGKPIADLSTSEIKFGEVQVGNNTLESIEISNTGCDTLFVSSISIANSIFLPSFSDTVLLPGQTAILDVSFSPVSNVFSNGVLELESNDGNFQVTLQGAGILSPESTLSGAIVASASTCSATDVEQLTITNNGNADLNADLLVSGLSTFSDASTQHYTDHGQSFDHTFDVLSGVDSLYIIITLNGDYDHDTEYATIFIEGELVEKIDDGAVSNGTDIIRTYGFKASENIAWFDDGAVTITVENSHEVNPGNGGSESNTVVLQTIKSFITLSESSIVVSALSSEIINATFDASSLDAGVYEANIVVSSNDPINYSDTIPCEFTVSGTPGIILSENSIDFGSEFVSGVKNKSFEIVNTGCDTLVITGVSFTEAVFTADVTVNDSIAPNESAIYNVVFSPSAESAYSGDLTIANNTGVDEIITLNGVCVGSDNPIIVIAGDDDYGDVVIVGTISKNFTVSNNGNSVLNVTNITTPHADISVDMTAFTVAEGTNQNITVTFVPTLEQDYSGEFTVISDAVSGTNTFTISAAGVSESTTLVTSMNSNDFGSIPLGITGEQTLQLENTGNTAYDINTFTLPAGYSSPLTATGTLIPGDVIEIPIYFDPSIATTYAGDIIITGGFDGTSTTETITGLGVENTIVLDVTMASTDFGQVLVGYSSRLPIVIENTGNTSLTISDTSFSNSVFSIDLPSLVVLSGESMEAELIFTPTSLSAYTDVEVQVIGDATEITNDVISTISAEGIGSQIALTGALNYNAVGINPAVPESLTLNIANNGASDFDMTGISFPYSVFTHDQDFNSPITVSAGGNLDVAITFDPTNVMDYTGTVYVNGNFNTGDNSIAITAIGSGSVIALSSDIDFGNIPSNRSTTSTFTIYNNGLTSMSVTGFNTLDATISHDLINPTAIEAGNHIDVEFTFSPIATVDYSSDIEVLSDATQGDNTLHISAFGTDVISAGFSVDQTTGNAPLLAEFTNESSGADFYVWDYGDGGLSYDENPSHTYSSAGSYIVSLVAMFGDYSETMVSATAIEVSATPINTATFTVLDGATTIEGASISVMGTELPLTDINGNTTHDLENGSYTYNISMNGYVSQSSIPFIVNGDVDVNVELEREAYALVFTVTSESSYIDRGTISMYNESILVGEVLINGGSASINLPNGSYTFEISSSDYNTYSSTENVIISNASASANVELIRTVAVPTYSANFSVGDGASAIENATVSLGGLDYYTASNGEVEITGMENGLIAYTVIAAGFESHTGVIEIQDGVFNEGVTLTAISDPVYTITFNVSDIDDNPLTGINLLIEGINYTSDVNGQVEVINVVDDTYSYEASLSGYFPNSENISVEGTNVVENIIMNEAWFTLEFNVFNAIVNTPIEGAAVSIYENDILLFSGSTNAAGSYSAIVANGSYSYIISKGGYELYNSIHDISVLDAVPDAKTIVLNVSSTPAYEAIFNVFNGNNVLLDNAVITIKKDDIIIESGTTIGGQASVDLVNGNYTYKVEADNHQLFSGAFTIASNPLNQNVNLLWNTFVVSFIDFDGTTALKEETVNYGSSATAPSDPTRTGYTFTSWDVVFDNIIEALTVTAQYDINTFEVNFVDFDNATELKTETVDYGSPATAPTDPSRTGYTFTGWDVAFDNITAMLTVTAQYDINTFEVVFVDFDGTTVLKTETVDYGSSATAPADPTRIGYTYTGWDVVFDNITAAIIVTAQYDINTFVVTFVDYDGTTILKSETVDYGSSATAPTDPTRTDYGFAGWDVAFNNITVAITVTAQYSNEIFTVTFVDFDGTTELKSETVLYGSAAIAPVDPVRTNYVFTGWDVSFGSVTAALTVTAQYASEASVVTFVDFDGTTVLKTETVNYGSSATAPSDPTRIGYTFTNWDVAFNNITAALTVTAQYSINTFVVSFVDFDGTTELKSETVNYGTSATAPTAPTRTGYAFTGWDVEFNNITAILTVTAEYSINTFVVSFVDFDGTTALKSETVNYGASATAPTDPTRIGYAFTSWDVEFNNITAVLTVTAEYSIHTFVVSFIDFDGITELKSETVNYGTSAIAPSDPARAGYTFTGWDVEFNNITAALTVTAEYSINTFVVSFVDFDGTTELKAETVNYGASATAPTDPTRIGYSFTGWDVEFDNITAILTVTAEYSINTFVVSFVDFDGTTTLKAETVNYGGSATAPTDPIRIGYTFTGWDVEFDNITAALTVTAQYSINTFVVGFVDFDGTELKTETVDYGTSATEPNEPTRAGFTFIGWDLPFDSIVSDIIITAQYSEDVVVFDVAFIVSDSIGVINGALVTLEGYSDVLTGSDGKAMFANVSIEDNIAYSVVASGYENFQGEVSVVDTAVSVAVSLIPVSVIDPTYTVSFSIKHDSLAIVGAAVSLEGYGTLVSDALGLVVFDSVQTAEDIAYSVLADGYKEQVGLLSVTDNDVSKDIQMEVDSIEGYSVLFIVSDNNNLIENASITLNGYGTLLTDDLGAAKFENVLNSDSISYLISASGYIDGVGKILVIDTLVLVKVVLELNVVEEYFSVTFNVSDGTESIANALVEVDGYASVYTDAMGVAIMDSVLMVEDLSFQISADGFAVFYDQIEDVDGNVQLDVVMLALSVDSDDAPLFSVYPNPAQNNVTIECEEGSLVQILNATGSIVWQVEESEANQNVDVDFMSEGVYIVRVNNRTAKLSIVH